MALPYSARVFQRIVMGSAVDVDMDASGRLLVPAELRKACGLSKEIVLVGLGSHFELWDAEKLAESEAKAMTENPLVLVHCTSTTRSGKYAQFNF